MPGERPAVGAWACRDDGGLVVDCATGAVRTAVFTPTAPRAADESYLVDLAADGTSGVRDLAGNPIDYGSQLLGSDG
jgi:hypothetical protein